MALGRAAANISKSTQGFFASGAAERLLKVAGGVTLAYGLSKAAGRVNRDISQATYDVAFGNPNFDQYVMGNDVDIFGNYFQLIPDPLAKLRYINRTTIGDFTRQQRLNQPTVSGDVVLGLYNSRLG